MKKYLITLSLALAACGSDQPDCSSSSLVGTWIQNGASFSFSESCQFNSPGCSASGTYTNTPNVTELTIEQTAPVVGCLPVGTYNCSYSTIGGLLDYACSVKND